MSVATIWGTTEEERRRSYPCDAFAKAGARALFRGVDVAAPASVVFRWLCQMRVAPYSYDWIDNGGRRSPQDLTPGLEELECGQRVMRIFELLEFEEGEHMTIALVPGESAQRLFGDLWVSYVVEPRASSASRLLVKLAFVRPRGALGALTGALLPWGDLVMMRRQLLNFKRLAEESES